MNDATMQLSSTKAFPQNFLSCRHFLTRDQLYVGNWYAAVLPDTKESLEHGFTNFGQIARFDGDDGWTAETVADGEYPVGHIMDKYTDFVAA